MDLPTSIPLSEKYVLNENIFSEGIVYEKK